MEKAGETAQAIALYESNVAEGFDGSHPYDRLAVLYHRVGRRDDEIRVLRRAIAVFERVAKSGRTDGQPKLERCQQRLSKLEKTQRRHFYERDSTAHDREPLGLV